MTTKSKVRAPSSATVSSWAWYSPSKPFWKEWMYTTSVATVTPAIVAWFPWPEVSGTRADEVSSIE